MLIELTQAISKIKLRPFSAHYSWLLEYNADTWGQLLIIVNERAI